MGKKRRERGEEKKKKRKYNAEDTDEDEKEEVVDVRGVVSGGEGQQIGGEGAATVDTSASNDFERGFLAFSTMSKLKGLNAAPALKIWNSLKPKQQKACADWERFVKGFTCTVPKVEELKTSAPCKGDGDPVKSSFVGESSRSVESQPRSKVTSETLQVDDGEDGETSNLSVGNDLLDDDGDSTDAATFFVTGIHVYRIDAERDFKNDERLVKSFRKISLAERMQYWERAREINLSELTRLKSLVVEKEKRVRAISVVSLLEVADRAQSAWDASTTAMLNELKKVKKKKGQEEAIYNKYKLKNVMGDVLNDLWHLVVMERLSSASTGLRNVLLGLCFRERRETQQPWGVSLLQGEYPNFECLRKSRGQSLWPRFTRSPFDDLRGGPVMDQRCVRFDQVSVQASSDVMKQEPEKLVVESVEKSLGSSEASSAAASTVALAALHSSAELAERARLSLLNRMQGKKKKNASNVKTESLTKTNTYQQEADERRSKTREQRRLRELTSLNNLMGVFSSQRRLMTEFLEHLIQVNFHVEVGKGAEVIVVEAPEGETNKCYDVRSLVSGESLATTNLRIFVEATNVKESFECSPRVMQFHLRGEGNFLSTLRSSVKTIGPNLRWVVRPQSVNCPDNSSKCGEMDTLRNLHLGCWVKRDFCFHAKTDRGSDLIEQLVYYSKENGFTVQEAATFVEALLKLDERLTQLVEAVFPHLAAEMHLIDGSCRLRDGKSVFSTVTLVGNRGRHQKQVRTSIGVRAFLNCPIEKKGKRKLIIQGFQCVRDSYDEPLSINLKHGSICFIPGKIPFAFSRDDSIASIEEVKCLTLEFACLKGLKFQGHGKAEAEMADCAVMLQRLSDGGQLIRDEEKMPSIGFDFNDSRNIMWEELAEKETQLDAVNTVVNSMISSVEEALH